MFRRVFREVSAVAAAVPDDDCCVASAGLRLSLSSTLLFLFFFFPLFLFSRKTHILLFQLRKKKNQQSINPTYRNEIKNIYPNDYP